jgi:glycosyltransferase 2 family protein
VMFLAWGLELPITFVEALIVVPTVLLLTTLPVSVAGWGVREGAMVAGFGFLGIPAEGALTVSVLFGVAQILVSLPGGVVWMLGRPKGEPPPELGGMAG